MNVEAEVAGRQALEAALERADLDLRVATAEYDAAKKETLTWKKRHPQLDSIRIVNGHAYVMVNAAAFTSSTLNTLCANETKARRRFSETLRVRADLLQKLQRI